MTKMRVKPAGATVYDDQLNPTDETVTGDTAVTTLHFLESGYDTEGNVTGPHETFYTCLLPDMREVVLRSDDLETV